MDSPGAGSHRLGPGAPGLLLSHTVADFDTWLEAYDAAYELRTSRGIIGHAANRSMDDPSLAIVTTGRIVR